MQPLFRTRDTSSITGPALPAVLNEDAFWPFEPKSLEECGISEMVLESLILQIFLGIGTVTGRGMTDRVRLPYPIVEQMLAQLRMRQLIAHARPAPLNDFYYSLTENGQKRAISYQKTCSYSGPAPVPLMDYVLSVEAQASNFEPITHLELKAALNDVTYEPSWLDFLGPAINSNSGIFLYGPPGNGKTTLARCLAACRGQEIWIPHAIIDDGMIIKFFDASYHVESAYQPNAKTILADQEHDRRWIRVRRPTVVVGGELTLDNLELRHDTRSNTCEAPLQLKSNCGCLLIDDFGRQRIAPAELLNRWIVPLESRHDYLNLPTGKKICVPFEQIILFSTNLKPEELVDEAFMRRVPFKINIDDPSPEEYLDLFRRESESLEIPWRPDVIERLMVKHYRSVGRPLRRCHPRDLMHQVKCLCLYRGERLELRPEYLDIACRNYFGDGPVAKPSNPDVVNSQWNMRDGNIPRPNQVPPSVPLQRTQATEMIRVAGGPQQTASLEAPRQPANSQPWATQPLSQPLGNAPRPSVPAQSPQTQSGLAPRTQAMPSGPVGPQTQRVAPPNAATQSIPRAAPMPVQPLNPIQPSATPQQS